MSQDRGIDMRAADSEDNNEVGASPCPHGNYHVCKICGLVQDNPQNNKDGSEQTETTRCVVCSTYCDSSGLCDAHKYDEQLKGQTETDEQDAILKQMIAQAATNARDKTFKQTDIPDMAENMAHYYAPQLRRYSHHQTIEAKIEGAELAFAKIKNRGYDKALEWLDEYTAELERLKEQSLPTNKKKED